METPKTYKFNDKNYKLSDFQSSSNDGWDEYRSALIDGDKNQDALNQAYDYMIDGINNGTVTIKDGNFYTNDENILNNKQLYGQVTYYLKRQLGKSNEYISPEEKRKVALTNSAFATNFNNYMFNNNTFNADDFINLDAPDEKTGKRAMTNRIAAVSNYLNQIDLDRDFKDFDDVTRQQYGQYIEDAKKAISDGTITSNEYLALSRLFGQQGNWGKIFTTEKDIQDADQPTSPEPTTTAADQQTPQQVLENYMTTEIPEYTGKEEFYWVNPDTDKYGGYLNGTIKILQNMSDDDIVDTLNKLNDHQEIDFNSIKRFRQTQQKLNFNSSSVLIPTNKQSRYMLMRILKSRNLLTDMGDGKYLYYTNKSPYALVWDTKQKKLFKTAARNVEYIVRNKLEQFRKSNGNASSDWYTKYMQDNNTSQVESNKKGGVLKAQNGMKWPFNYSLNFKPQAPDFMSYSPSSSWFTKYYDANLPSGGYTGSNYNKAVFYTDDDLKNTNRYRRWYNPETKQYELQSRGDMASTDKISTGNGLYDVEGIYGSQTPDDNLEAMSWNSDWIQRLTTNEKLAETFARRYRDLNGSTNGAQATNWFNSDGSFNFEKFKQEIPNGNGKLFVWSDKLNGIGHDVYKGRMYGIFDPSTNQVVYYNNIPEGYKVNGDANPFNDITDLYMLEKDPNYKAGEIEDGKQIKSTKNLKDLEIENPYDKPGKADLLALSRLKMALDNNEKNANILKNGLTPVQYDTYRENTPITGAYTTMSQYRNMAANINSQMADMQSADGRARILAQLKGASQADELNQKGIAADFAERVRAEQLSRQYETQNKERRQTIANKNIDNLAAYRKELSSIDANRNMADFTSKDTYLKQYEADYRQKQLEKKQMYDNYIKSIAEAEATSSYTDEMQQASDDFNKWFSQQSTENQNNTTWLKLQPEYQKYLKTMSDIKIKQNAKMLQTYMAITGQNYIPDNPWIKPKNIENHKYKMGGRLIPKNKFLK